MSYLVKLEVTNLDTETLVLYEQEELPDKESGPRKGAAFVTGTSGCGGDLLALPLSY